MATSIEWTDETWNPTRGCSRVSSGCDHCYAMREARRHDHPGGSYEALTRIGKRGVDWSGQVRLVPEMLAAPLHWRKPRKVFVNSMSDLFHEALADEDIDRVFAVMALAQHHTFQVLTKRPARARDYLADLSKATVRWSDAAMALEMPRWLREAPWLDERYWGDSDDAVWLRVDSETDSGSAPLRNVWMGVSAEDQQRADERIPLLLQTPGAVRFVSLEPLLGPVRLDYEWLMGNAALAWAIIGGESGQGARPFNIAWARSILAQCKAAGVAYFYKQGGASNRCGHDSKGGHYECFPPGLQIREFPHAS